MDRDTFLSFGIKPQKVHIDSLNKDIWLRELSYAAAVEVGKCASIVDKAVVTVINCVCDEKGNALFTADDIELVKKTFSYYSIQEITGRVAEITTATDLLK